MAKRLLIESPLSVAEQRALAEWCDRQANLSDEYTVGYHPADAADLGGRVVIESDHGEPLPDAHMVARRLMLALGRTLRYEVA